MNGSRIEAASSQALAPAVRDAWRNLLTATGPEDALTSGPDWFDMMAGEVAGDGLVFISRDASERVAGLLPCISFPWSSGLRLGPMRLFGQTFRVYRALAGHAVGDFDWRAACVAMSEAFRSGRRCDAVLLDALPSGDLPGLITACRAAGWTCVHTRGPLPHHYLKLGATREETLARRTHKSLKKIEGRGRALARELGCELKLVEFRNVADLAPYRAALDELMAHTWQADRLGERFRVAELEPVARAGWLRSFALIAATRPIAFAACYQGFGQFVYGTIGYDAAFASFSPGALLLLRILEALHADSPPAWVDFGVGPGQYKEEWSTLCRTDGSVLLLPPGSPHRLRLRCRASILRLLAWGHRFTMPTGGHSAK